MKPPLPNVPASPALVLRLNDLTIAARDRLVAQLADNQLVGIHEDDPFDPQVWTAHFLTTDARDAASAALSRDAAFRGISVSSIELEDDDWARRTQADLRAIRIGRVVIAPPWDLPGTAHGAPRTAHDDVLVIIEPSRGFGTGHHQSTRLCLVLLQNRNPTGQTVLDVGTGSGVLAIAAAKLGAAFVCAIDVDPDAVENARENIALNGMAAIVEAHVGDFSTARRSPADVVTANLTGSLLFRGADALARLVKPAGELIVSGFNVDERPMVEEAFAHRFVVTETAEEDDWWAYVLTRINSQRPTPNSQGRAD